MRVALIVAALIVGGCSDPAPASAPEPPVRAEAASRPAPEAPPEAPPRAEAEPAPEAEAEPEAAAAADLPLTELVAVPDSAPPWISFAAEQCAQGRSQACWLLGAAHDRGTLGATDPSRARQLFARACAGEGGYGCAELAELGPAAEAQAHLTRGCDANRADACAALAEHLEHTDEAGATAARMRACSLGKQMTCLPVPTAFPRDATAAPRGAPSEASRIPAGAQPTVLGAAQRCDRGMAAMCAWLGLQYGYDNDFGLPPDAERAFELARRSCNEEALTGCTQLGMLLMANAQSPADARAAGAALGRACAAGIGPACTASLIVASRSPQMAPLVPMMRFEACLNGEEASCETGS